MSCTGLGSRTCLPFHFFVLVVKRIADIAIYHRPTRPLAVPSQVLNLLLDMPGGFAEVLLERGSLPRILQLVELQLVRQAFQDGYVRP